MERHPLLVDAVGGGSAKSQRHWMLIEDVPGREDGRLIGDIVSSESDAEQIARLWNARVAPPAGGAYTPPDPNNYNPEIVHARRRDPIAACDLLDLLEQRFGIARADAVAGVAGVFFMDAGKLDDFYQDFYLVDVSEGAEASNA
jgi:hypothetical protein